MTEARQTSERERAKKDLARLAKYFEVVEQIRNSYCAGSVERSAVEFFLARRVLDPKEALELAERFARVPERKEFNGGAR